MRERFPRFFDAIIWAAVIMADAALLLGTVAAGFLVLQKLGGNYADLALVGAAGSLSYAVGCPLSARLGPRVGLRRMVVAGAATYIVASLLMSLTSSVWQVVGAAALSGLAGALLWPNVEASLSRGRQGPLLRRRLSIFNTMWCAGATFGPFLGSLIYPSELSAALPDGRAAINLVFYAAAALALGTLVCLLLWRNEPPCDAEVRRHIAAETPRDPARLRAFLLMAYVGNFMCYVVIAVLRNLYQRLASQQWAGQQPARKDFVLLTALGLASTLMFLAMFFAHRWPYRLKRLVFSQVALVAAVAVVALTGNFWVSLAAFLVIGVASSFIYSGSLFYSIEGTTEESHMAGWHEAVLGLGGVCGLLFSGFSPSLLRLLNVESDYWLVRTPYLVAAGIFALGIVVQLVIYQKHRPQFVRQS